MGAWYNPHSGAYGRGYARVRAVWRRRDGRVLQPANRHVCARRSGVRSVRVARCRLRRTTRAPEPTRKRDRARTCTGTGARAPSSAATTGRRPRTVPNYGPGGSTTSGIRTSNGGAAVNRSGVQDRRRLAAPPAATSTRATMATCTGGTRAAAGNKATDPAAGIQPKGTVAKGTEAPGRAQQASATMSRATVPERDSSNEPARTRPRCAFGR